jgi:hypothetical protein
MEWINSLLCLILGHQWKYSEDTRIRRCPRCVRKQKIKLRYLNKSLKAKEEWIDQPG